MSNKILHQHKNINTNPANTRRCFDVNSTSFERYERQMDVETTLCAYWEIDLFRVYYNNKKCIEMTS